MTAPRTLHPPLAEVENALFAPLAAVDQDAGPPPAAPDSAAAGDEPLVSPPSWLAAMIDRRVTAEAAYGRGRMPAAGQIVRVSRARDGAGQPLELARPFAVLLNEPAEHGLWYGWCCAPDLDWATAFDLLLEPDDEPFDPLAGMVQLWNPVYVQPVDCDRVLTELLPERLAAVRALAVDFVTGAIPETAPIPGCVDTRTLASGHIVLTGTPLGGSDDPRHEYQRIYHHAAEVALRASARAVPRRLAFDALHMAADALESNVPDRLKVYWTAWEEWDAAVPGLDVPVSAGPDELRRIAAELLPPGTGQ